MKLELSVPRERYLVGENVGVDVSLTNTGTQAIDAPKLASFLNTQPVYRLTGPSYPGGVSFSLRDVKLANQPAALRTEDPPATQRLEPGEQLDGGLKLHRLKRPALPGEYELSAEIQWKTWSARSVPIRFRVDSATYLDSSLGIDLATSSTRRIRAVWLAQTASGRVLGETFQYESRPDLGEFDTTGSRIIADVGSAASAPFCPWTNFERTSAALGWHGWREGSRLFALAAGQPTPTPFDMGSPEAAMVHPALLSRGGELDVAVLSGNGKQLRLIRFAAGVQGVPGSPRVVWSLDLPEPVHAARAGLGPEAAGSGKAILLVSETATDVGIRIARMADDGGTLSQRVSIPGARLISDSQAAVTIMRDGELRSSLMVASAADRRALLLADVSLPAHAQVPSIAVQVLGKLDAPAEVSATAFTSSTGGTVERSWMAGTKTGGLVGGGRSMRSIKGLAAGQATDFLRMSGAAYVLVLDPQRGPALQGAGF